MSITGKDRYHEDYRAGDRVIHRRGHTVSVSDNQLLSLLTMNTAQTHYNSDSLATYLDGAFESPLLNACVALALAVGLTSEDMTENALADLGYRALRMPAPLFVADTVYASSDVLSTDEPSARVDAGVLSYRITARKPDGQVVLTVERRALIKRRSHWKDPDEQFSQRAHTAASVLLRATPDQ